MWYRLRSQRLQKPSASRQQQEDAEAGEWSSVPHKSSAFYTRLLERLAGGAQELEEEGGASGVSSSRRVGKWRLRKRVKGRVVLTHGPLDAAPAAEQVHEAIAAAGETTASETAPTHSSENGKVQEADEPEVGDEEEEPEEHAEAEQDDGEEDEDGESDEENEGEGSEEDGEENEDGEESDAEDKEEAKMKADEEEDGDSVPKHPQNGPTAADAPPEVAAASAASASAAPMEVDDAESQDPAKALASTAAVTRA